MIYNNEKRFFLKRRDFLKFSAFLASTPVFARKGKINIKLPSKKLTYYHLYGKKKGKKVLIIGGIHGNEVGAYKCASMLKESEIEKGELLIIPRSNFTSILANLRGYNGDMNRKFEYVSKKDPDFYYVETLKELILCYKPDVVISMHDGFGFNIENAKAWGQSIVIDELNYKSFNLYQKALFVKNNANKFLQKKLSIINTKTFSSDIHKEQKKALTAWCLRHNIESYCIEASKQLPTLESKIYTHLVMLREFFKLFEIEIKNIEDMMKNMKKYLNFTPPSLILKINGVKYKISDSKNFVLNDGSFIEVFSDVENGEYLLPLGVNLNWRSFYFSNLTFEVKRDFERFYLINIKRA